MLKALRYRPFQEVMTRSLEVTTQQQSAALTLAGCEICAPAEPARQSQAVEVVHNLSTEGESKDHKGHHASSSGQSIEAMQLLRLPRHQGADLVGCPLALISFALLRCT